MDNEKKFGSSESDTAIGSNGSNEIAIESLVSEELTDEQLLQMAEGSCSWGANCSKGGSC